MCQKSADISAQSSAGLGWRVSEPGTSACGELSAKGVSGTRWGFCGVGQPAVLRLHESRSESIAMARQRTPNAICKRNVKINCTAAGGEQPGPLSLHPSLQLAMEQTEQNTELEAHMAGVFTDSPLSGFVWLPPLGQWLLFLVGHHDTGNTRTDQTEVVCRSRCQLIHLFGAQIKMQLTDSVCGCGELRTAVAQSAKQALKQGAEDRVDSDVILVVAA